jgi:hypothetical protein
MSEPSRTDPVVTQRGLSDRSRELLAGTRRTDELAAEKSPHRVIRSLWWPLVYLVLALGAVDFAIAPLVWAARSDFPTAPVIVVCCGLVAVQTFLIGLGLVFGRHSLASRLLLVGALLLMVFACGTAGYMSSVFTAEVDMGGQKWFSLAGMAWCGLVALLVGMVLPLCFVRGVLGWRLTNPDEIRERERLGPEPANRYTLRDLFVLTTMIGLTLGVPRFTYDPRAGRYDDERFWIAIAVCISSAALASLIVVILAAWALRPNHDAKWCWSIITSLGWSLVVSMALSLAANPGSYLWLIIAWLIWLQAFIGGALLGVIVLRAHGWCWERAGRELKTV